MALQIKNPWACPIAPSLTRILSKFHDISLTRSQVIALEVTLPLLILFTMEKSEFRVLIKHCFLMGKNTVEAKQWLDKCYGTSAPANSTVKYWFAEFRRDRTTTTDAPRSGRPNEAVTPENIKKIREIVLADRKVKLNEIAKTIGISKERVGHIIHECLHMRKLCARWVPRFLTIDQKDQRVRLSTANLALFNRNKKDFLRRFVTMDETWIHHYTPESNRQSAEWLLPGESRPKRPKTQQSAGKVLASIFWDSHGILFIDYLEHGKTINKQYYCALLDRLDTEIKAKRPHMAKKKVLFHTRPFCSRYDRQIEGITLRIGSPSTIFARFSTERLFPVSPVENLALW